MTSLRSTYAAGDHPHATCVTFFSFRLSPPFPPPFSLSFSLLPPSSSLLVSLSAPLRIFFFLFVLVFLLHLSSPFFSLSLPSHAVSRSLSLSQCRFVPFCGFTSRPDFTNGHTVPFWGNMSHVVPSFPSRKESYFGVVRLTAPPALQGNEIIESDTLIP